MTAPAPRILIVDDTPENIDVLDAMLSPRGYAIEGVSSGAQALDRLATEPRPDLVLLDIVMPEMGGYEVCRRIRATPTTELLPVVMITASSGEEKLNALEAGADDFIMKPFDKAELLARVRSLVRIKQYHDTILQQATELAEWNRQLEERVEKQVAQLDRMGRLKRFLAPQVADLIVSSGDESFLESHRREITVVFCDLRGFVPFAETVEPEVTMSVLAEYHEALGDLVFRFEGTLERFTGDGVMVFFNDPIPCTDAPLRSVRMGVAMRNRVADLADSWRRSGHDLGFAVGIAQGHATLGSVGFGGRSDYAAIGTVTNLADRLCGAAAPGQILVSQRVHAAVEGLVVSTQVSELQLKGFSRPVTAYEIVGLDAARVRT